MAIFGSKKPAKGADIETKKTDNGSVGEHDLHNVIRRPRITEKASMGTEKGMYAFEVSRDANKKTIAAAVKAMYNVTPVKVAVITVPHKQVIVRGKKGIRGGGKKAYVYLKKGETIEFV